MDILSILNGLGLGVCSNAIYDFIKSDFANHRSQAKADFEHRLDAFLRINGQKIQANTIIQALANEGKLVISQSQLYAPEQIVMGAAHGASFAFGDNSTSTTNNTGIQAGAGAWITGSNAAIVQGTDGSISFYVGNDNKK
jgi:hypothetical protein